MKVERVEVPDDLILGGGGPVDVERHAVPWRREPRAYMIDQPRVLLACEA
jgi:hypothetical protein